MTINYVNFLPVTLCKLHKLSRSNALKKPVKLLDLEERKKVTYHILVIIKGYVNL